MTKKKRQDLIRAIIETKAISNQLELQRELAKRGMGVRQPTLSRDLREMAVIKMPKGLGKFVYQFKAEIEVVNSSEFRHKFINLVKEIKHTENLIIIKTPPGEAQGVAKVIDNTKIDVILGTVGGDDTIIVVVDKKQNIKKILNLFNNIKKGMKA